MSIRQRLELALSQFANRHGLYLEARSTRVHARVATGPERERLWSKLVATYPGFDFFQRNAGDRQIPVVVLDRID